MALATCPFYDSVFSRQSHDSLRICVKCLDRGFTPMIDFVG